MRKEWFLSAVLVLAIVACDSDEEATVGAFSSSLSGETAVVEDLTIAQKDTFCKEIVNWQAAKMSAVCSMPAGAAPDASQVCSSEDDLFVGCAATVAEIEGCMEVVVDASFANPLMAALFGCSATAPDETAVAECESVQYNCPEAFSGPAGEEEFVEVDMNIDGEVGDHEEHEEGDEHDHEEEGGEEG